MQWHFLDKSQLPVAVQTWELPPGGSEGMHAHPAGESPLEEMYLVLEGTGSMRVGDDVHEIGPGDSVLASQGVEHDLRNTGTGRLKVLVIWGKPGEADWSAFGSAKAAREHRAS
ncbi:MAG TPA: cupin domain-containing protein [Arthrobacter sp.]|nr:cupin domain-containing protein [Arthrobacter sp.]